MIGMFVGVTLAEVGGLIGIYERVAAVVRHRPENHGSVTLTGAPPDAGNLLDLFRHAGEPTYRVTYDGVLEHFVELPYLAPDGGHWSRVEWHPAYETYSIVPPVRTPSWDWPMVMMP